MSKNTRIEELVSLKKQVAEIEKAAKKSVPNAVSLIDAAWLIQKIIEEENLNSENESRGQICNVAIGMFQADSLLSKCLKDRVSTLILSNNADFITHAGEKCTQIKELYYKSKLKTVDNMTLSFTCNESAKS